MISAEKLARKWILTGRQMLMGRRGTKGGCDVAMMISLYVMAMELVFSCSVCMFARSEEVYCEVKMVFLRYMNYWLTTTTTLTQYSYTVTSKIASLLIDDFRLSSKIFSGDNSMGF